MTTYEVLAGTGGCFLTASLVLSAIAIRYAIRVNIRDVLDDLSGKRRQRDLAAVHAIEPVSFERARRRISRRAADKADGKAALLETRDEDAPTQVDERLRQVPEAEIATQVDDAAEEPTFVVTRRTMLTDAHEVIRGGKTVRRIWVITLCLAFAFSLTSAPAMVMATEQGDSNQAGEGQDAGTDPEGNDSQDGGSSDGEQEPVPTPGPVAELRVDEDAVRYVKDGLAYFNRAQAVTVAIAGVELDVERTVVAGRSLEDLLELLGTQGQVCDPYNDAISYEGMAQGVDDEGRATYAIHMILRDGKFAVSGFAFVVDAEDREAGTCLERNGHTIDSLVVDTTAPSVEAYVDALPHNVCEGEDGAYVFFGSATRLRMRFSDENGVRAVASSAPAGSVAHRLELSERGDTGSVALGQGPLTSAFEVTVSDLAGNTRTWSFAKEGRAVTFEGAKEVENDPLVAKASGTVVSLGHPKVLVEDREAPSVSIEGIAQDAQVREGVELSVFVDDNDLSDLLRLDADQTVVTVSRDGRVVLSRTVEAFEMGRDGRAVCKVSLDADKDHGRDGRYVVTASATDLSGNVSPTALRAFTIDTTPPELQVAFLDGGACKGYFASQRVARVSIVERSLDESVLNGSDAPVRVTPSARFGRKAEDVDVGRWHVSTAGSCWCDVTFPVDGAYSFAVEGHDVAGNPMVGATGTTVNEAGCFASDEFVIDATKPQVHVSLSSKDTRPGKLGRRLYYARAVVLEVSVTDRNLDADKTSVTDSVGREVVPSWKGEGRRKNGTVESSASITYVEDESGGEKSPVVHAYDRAGNEFVAKVDSFVVDQTAPVIEGVSTNGKPTSVKYAHAGEDPTYFYGAAGAGKTTLTIAFGDTYCLDSAWVDDPDKTYSGNVEGVRGKEHATLSIELRDHATEDSQHETVLDRNVRVYVRDIAGNVRWWSIDRKGNVDAQRSTSTSNASLDDAGIFPLALVRDVTAPRVWISGVEEGAFYHEGQTATVSVDEFNFAYLRSLEPSRVVMSVERWEADDGREHSSWTRSVREFEGQDAVRVCEQPFAADGHYAITAQLEDCAGNKSDLVRVGEFTIDKTAPEIQVTWDNEDVRNEKYYRAPRTATIRVLEHNFDEKLLSVSTTGSKGGWVDRGDAHTLTVSFAEASPPGSEHTLRVEGKDQAGNAAKPYEAKPFVIDLTSPTIAFGRRASDEDVYATSPELEELREGAAFAQAVEPVVTLEDEANFDAAGVTVRLEGKRQGLVDESLAPVHRDAVGDSGLEVYWDNLGFVDGEGGGSYAIDADDVYTVSAQVIDLAGNESDERSVTFSVNRYGSNYFFEEIEGLEREKDGTWSDQPLMLAPCVVVHEVNVSGPEDGEGDKDAQTVTIEHANATSELEQTSTASDVGYAVKTTTQASDCNPYEGWTECTYTIGSGNFGRGSAADRGDGGQGLYRVNVASRDKASNNNTTARYWGSSQKRTEAPSKKTATLEFTLDELGPVVDDVNLPEGLCVGDGFEATFSVVDEVTRGDFVSVLVDGEPQEVWATDSGEVVGADGAVPRQGTFAFRIPARPFAWSRVVEIRVSDYTDRASRTQVVRADGFWVTTLVAESSVAVAMMLALGLVCWKVAQRALPER